jgi:hypothetical protein
MQRADAPKPKRRVKPEGRSNQLFLVLWVQSSSLHEAQWLQGSYKTCERNPFSNKRTSSIKNAITHSRKTCLSIIKIRLA